MDNNIMDMLASNLDAQPQFEETEEQEISEVDIVNACIKKACFEKALFLDTRNIKDVHLDLKEFNEGVKETSKMCGEISALVSIGVSLADAFTYVSERYATKDVLENNEKISEINKEIATSNEKKEKLESEAKEI